MIYLLFIILTLFKVATIIHADKNDEKLIFEEHFNGNALNDSIWNRHDWNIHGDAELQLYLKEDCIVKDGLLTLRTRYNPKYCHNISGSICKKSHKFDKAAKLYNYSSCWVDTKGKFFHKFGKFEVRAKLPNPNSYGVWPAHWLMPEPEASNPPNVCWPVGGEIDIMESLGITKDPREKHGGVLGTYHWANSCGKDLHCDGSVQKKCGNYSFNGLYPSLDNTQIDFSKQFHTFSVTWNETSIQWFVDNNKYWERHNGDRPGFNGTNGAKITTNPMYLILNTAISSYSFPPAGTRPFPRLLPVVHQIDWVKVYSK
jgi:beta-glucanase (GH16 family)